MIRGGLRTRLIVDSARLTIIAGLEALGWFDPTIHDSPPGTRTHRRLRYITRPANWQNPVEPNALAISSEDIYDDPRSLGDDPEDTIRAYADIFAESDQLGYQLAGDVRDVLLGKFDQLGRHGPVLDVYDFRGATPAPFTSVDIETVTVDRAESQARQWQNHWFMVRFDLLDEYLDEYDATHLTTTWNEDFAPTWQFIQTAEAFP